MSLFEERLRIARRRKRPSRCDGCIGNPQSSNHNPLISGGHIRPDWDLDADLIVLGACGGYEEEAQGEPLVGKAGRKLRRGIEWAAAGRPFKYARWNLYNCRCIKMGAGPFVVNRKPNQMTVKEMRDCSSRWLFPYLRETRTKFVLILGVDVDRFVLGKRFDSFHKHMGQRCLVPQTGISPRGLPNEIVSYGKLYKVDLL